MSDEIDKAQEMTEMYTNSMVESARKPIPVGEVGDCVECGYESPRLVGKRCAMCRDGRER